LGRQTGISDRRVGSQEIQTEFLRKAIHLLIAIVPSFAGVDVTATLSLLGAGAVVYTYAELKRLTGYSVVFISSITFAAARDRDEGRFVLGPVTLAIGAMLALLLYPEPAASIAIYALAFGDGVSSIVGKLFGRIRVPFTGGKTMAGSLACFVAVFFVAFRVFDKVLPSFVVAVAATALEAFPTKDLDNILLPVGTGFLAAELLL
jgi:dolichol kinase